MTTNVIIIEGHLARDPEVRTDRVVLQVAVPRQDGIAAAASGDVIPVACHEVGQLRDLRGVTATTRVRVVGSLRRHLHQKVGYVAERYEIEASHVEVLG